MTKRMEVYGEKRQEGGKRGKRRREKDGRGE